MSDTSTDLQDLIDKFQSGGPAARRAFLERALDRVRRLAAKMLAESFPRLQSQHDLESIVNESWLRLSQSLEETNPPTVQDFFRLAAFKIRQVLIDMVRSQQRRQRQLHDSGTPFDDPSLRFPNPSFELRSSDLSF